jgi:hypothetical protein
MNTKRPDFIDSDYFYWNDEGETIIARMQLLPNAPKYVRTEYEEYVRQYEVWYETWNEDNDIN